MYLLGVSLLILALWYFDIGPLAGMDWWWILVPFGVTALWWTWADFSGYTKRREMDKMDQRKKDRHERQRANLGLGPPRNKR